MQLPDSLGLPKVTGILAIAIILVACPGLAGAVADSTNSTPATPQTCGTAAVQTLDSVDQATAIANAKESSNYSAGVASYYNPTYWGVFQLGEFSGPETCAHQIQSLNVVFQMYNSTGFPVANLVIAEYANYTVFGSIIQNEPQHPANSAFTQYGINTGGYSVSANSAASDVIYSSYADYTQPTASEPPTGCSTTACEVNSWTGVAADYYGYNGSFSADYYLEQAGTTGWCNSSGTTCPSGHGGYWAWAEAIGAPGYSNTVNCTSAKGGAVSISGGDTIYTWTINNAYDGGNDSSYVFYVEDTHTSTYCILSQSKSSLTAPYWATYQTEQPYYHGNAIAPLAKFGTVTFSSMKFWNSAGSDFVTPYTAYNSGYYVKNVMENSPYPSCPAPTVNILTSSSISSSNQFTNVWQTSEYTGQSTSCAV